MKLSDWSKLFWKTARNREISREPKTREGRRETKKRKERSRRLALYEARISRHEIAATRENLRGLINGSGPGEFSRRPVRGRKRERENRCVTSGGQCFRAARIRFLSLLFAETDRRSNGTAAVHFDLLQPRPTTYTAFLTAAFGFGTGSDANKNATESLIVADFRWTIRGAVFKIIS